MAALTSLSTTYYSNVSTSASTTATTFTGCGPCRFLMIIDPAFGHWDVPASNISALRTTQVFVDQNYNTTSTSVDCNTSVLSGYYKSITNPYVPSYGVNDECDLVATYSAFGGTTDGSLYHIPVTVTVTGSVGQALYLGPNLAIYGEVSTTDSTGSPSCLVGPYNIDLTTHIGAYTDPITRIKDPWGDNTYANFLLLPDLSKYVTGIDAVLEQCTYINVGGAPIALTPANQIVLPRITIPASQPSVSPTTTADTPFTSATNPPVTSNVPVIPASTTPTTGNTEPSATQNSERPEDPEETQGGSTSRPAPDDSEDDTPGNTQPSIVLPSQPSSPPSELSDENSPSQSSNENIPAVPSSEGATDEPPSSSQSPPVIVPVEPSASQTQSNVGSSPAVEIVPVGSTQASHGAAVPSRVTSIQDAGLIGTVSSDSDAYAIGTATTVTAGGPAATIAGTVYSALPSGSGVAAVNEPADPFASYIAVGISGQSLGVQSDESNEDRYVLENGATLATGQDAAVVSGTTFSALATGGGVLAVANGQSTTLTTLPGAIPSLAVPIVPVRDGQEAYVLEGGSTVTAGGEVIAVSGTTYSALPSGRGVVAVADAISSTLAEPALAAGDETPNTHVIGSSITISQGGSAATISGTTYLALPSGSGVEIVADGQTTTLDAAELTQNSAPSAPDAYVVGGSSTISAGGSAVILSGTTYSALPSVSGIVAIASGQTTTLAKTAIAQPDSTLINTYIAAGTVTISAGGSAAVISGTTYSVLPSGSGVVVIAGGKSSTVGSDGIAEPSNTASTDEDDVSSFEGSASFLRGQLGSIACWAGGIAMVIVLV